MSRKQRNKPNKALILPTAHPQPVFTVPGSVAAVKLNGSHNGHADAGSNGHADAIPATSGGTTSAAAVADTNVAEASGGTTSEAAIADTNLAENSGGLMNEAAVADAPAISDEVTDKAAALPTAGEAAATAPAPAHRLVLPAWLPRLKPLGRHTLVILVFAVLSVMFTWPVGEHFATDVPGGGDAWQYIWNLWWIKKSLIDLGTDPFYTNHLYYPGGVTLLFDTTVILECVLALPFMLLGASLVQAYNGIILASFVLAGYGTWLLVRYLTGNTAAALIAGFAFAFCPFHFGRMLGHMNLVSIQWLPFYLWVLFHTLGKPGEPLTGEFSRRRIGWAVVAALFLAANFYTEFTFAIFLILFTGFYVGWRLLVDQGTGWRGLLNLNAPLLIVAVLFAALAGPLLLPTLQAQAGQEWMKPPLEETLIYSSDLLDGFTPTAFHPLFGSEAALQEARIPERNRAERAAYLGFSVLLVAGLALRRRRHIIFWAVAAVVFWLLSLGPILHIDGYSYFFRFEREVALPYAFLYEFVPGFNVMRVPARFVILASLALAVLVGYALAGLASWTQTRRKRRLAEAVFTASFVLVAGAIMFDFLAVPFPTVQVPTPAPFYQQIAQDDEQYAILELPIRDLSDHLLAQTWHDKPIIYGKLSRQPEDPFISSRPLLLYLLADTTAGWLPKQQIAPALSELRDQNVRYAVVHWWAFTDKQKAAMQTKLARLFPDQTPLNDLDNQLTVYEIRPPTEGGGR